MSGQTGLKGNEAYEDGGHADFALLSGKVSGHEENNDGHWNGSDGQAELDVGFFHHDDDELNGEAEEEEKVKFEQRDVNLHS